VAELSSDFVPGYHGIVDFGLDSVEARVLGSLIEKEITTPEYYPLTLNALVNACNQRSSRDPVVDYDEDAVQEAIERLRHRGLASVITGASMRVPKYRQLFSEALNLGRRETALLCVLMLRGPQTPGELRSRSERLHPFNDLEEIEAVLERLSSPEPQPFIMRLPKLPGTKEARYSHLLSGEPPKEQMEAAPSGAAAFPPAPRVDRLTAVEEEVRHLREDMRALEEKFAAFRSQFE